MQSAQHYLTRMKTDMQLRGLATSTQESYQRYTRKFLEHCCAKEVDELDESDARGFLIRLLQEGKLDISSINLHNAAVRFFFAVTLNKTLNYLQLPRFKKRKTLPEILSRKETQRLIHDCHNLKHKAYFLLAYGGGLRVSEIANLRIKDIDSGAMRIFVRGGKGSKDRYTLLSNECLCALREYWSVYRPKHPEGWLFLGQGKSERITTAGISSALERWAGYLGITKAITMHSLRHGFATHLLEDGASIFQIKELLGHASLSSTVVYLHLADTTTGLVSPADRYIPYD